MIRVFSRLLDLDADVSSTATQRHLWHIAEDWMPSSRPGDYNQALMDLGKWVCTPRSPACSDCPIQRHCRAFAAGTQAERPVKATPAPTPHYDVAAGVIHDATDRLLIAQRPNEGLLGGLWEFPGGKVEADETLEACLVRELREELAIEVWVGEQIVQIKHAFSHFRITLHAFECRHRSGTPQLIGAQAVAWVTLDELSAYSFGKADRLVIAHLRTRDDRLL